MALTIHYVPVSPRAFKVLWAANELGLDYDTRRVDFRNGEQRSSRYLAINPNGRIPVIEDGDFVLWESNAILSYLASKKPGTGLLPVDAKPRLAVEKWLYWDYGHWDPACVIYVYERVVKRLLNLGECVTSEIERADAQFQRSAAVLETELSHHAYVAGDDLSVADIALASPLSLAGHAGIPLDPYPAIRGWLERLQSLPSWQRTAETQFPAGILPS